MFYQARSVACIFYNEKDMQMIIDKLGFADNRYAYIHHTRDVNGDGTPKMAHYHFFGSRKSPISIQTLQNLSSLCSETMMYENVHQESSLLAYFLHKGTTKSPYDIKEIVSNFDVKILDETKKVKPVDIVDAMSMIDKGCTVKQVLRKYPKLFYSLSNLIKYKEITDNSFVDNWADIDERKIIKLK